MQGASVARERRDNEYLHDAHEYLGERDWVRRLAAIRTRGIDGLKLIESFSQRPRFVERYAWAVPNEQALAVIAKYGPVVEIGAGTGYWAYLLRRRKVSVRAYDLFPPHRHPNHYHPDQKTWTTVYKGGPEKAALYPKHALFLCWPPYETKMARQALCRYEGSTVIYVGEGNGGCTADGAFHALLEKDWVQVEEVSLPVWPGIRDLLTVWKRKDKTCRSRDTVSQAAGTKVSGRTATAASKPKQSRPKLPRSRTAKRRTS